MTNLCDLLGDVPAPQPLVASIGPVTSKTALDRGLRVDVEASEHTIDGLVDALRTRTFQRRPLSRCPGMPPRTPAARAAPDGGVVPSSMPAS